MRTEHAPFPELYPVAEQEGVRVQEADLLLLATHAGEGCKLCQRGPEVDFTMAFQPIVSVSAGSVVAYEALVRGLHGEAASTVLESTLHNNRYAIDQRCREKAITLSAGLGILETTADLSVNFYPNAVYEPKQCLQRTLSAAVAAGFPLTRIIFEITEAEQVHDHDHLLGIMREYHAQGLRTAIDDFGAGHSGLSLLSHFQPDLLKLDRALVEHIDERPASRSIVRSVVQVCRDLGIRLVAEGIEREEEMQVLCGLGIEWMQGYFFARPALEALPAWP